MPDSHKHRLRLPADIRRGLVHRTVLGLSRLLMLAALLPLGACSKPTGEQVDGGMATANISPYNHTISAPTTIPATISISYILMDSGAGIHALMGGGAELSYAASPTHARGGLV